MSVPLDVGNFDRQIKQLTNHTNAMQFLWSRLAPAGIPKSTGSLVTLEIYGCKIVVEQVDIGYLHETIEHIAADLVTIACEIDLLIKIRNITSGSAWTEAERRSFIADLGVFSTGPWKMPYRTRSSRIESIWHSLRLDALTRRYARLRRKYPNR